MSEPITDAELDAIRARAKAATPGPWTYSMSGDLGTKAELRLIVRRHLAEPLGTMEPNWIPGNADMSFIKNAREAVPALIAEVERLHKDNKACISQLNDAVRDNVRLEDYNDELLARLAAICEKAERIIYEGHKTQLGKVINSGSIRALADALKEFP